MSGSKEQAFHLKEVSFRNYHQNESLEMQNKKKYFFFLICISMWSLELTMARMTMAKIILEK